MTDYNEPSQYKIDIPNSEPMVSASMTSLNDQGNTAVEHPAVFGLQPTQKISEQQFDPASSSPVLAGFNWEKKDMPALQNGGADQDFGEEDFGQVQEDGDGEELDDNMDLDDLLNEMFVAGEISTMNTVRGTKVQTLTIDVTRIKTLLTESDNEFINGINSKFLINMLNIAMRRKENDTIGKTILNLKGLPTWIVPVVTGEWTSVDRAYATVKKESFQAASKPGSCTLKLDPPVAPMYTGYTMETDKQTEMPGSWVKSRSDFTVTAVNRDKVKPVKLPGNSYTTNVKLTQDAIAFIASKRSNKKTSTFIRMLTNPNAVRSVDVDLVGTERAVSIVGFLIREPDSTSRAITPAEFKQNFIPLNCISDPSALEHALDKHFPTVQELLQKAQLKTTSVQTYLDLLAWYNYERTDLTAGDWRLIGDLIKSNLTSVTSTDWAATHTEQISKLKRTVSLKPKELMPADNGKYMFSSELDQYVQETKINTVVLPDVSKATSVEPTAKSTRWNSISMDSVHGTIFRSDNGKFYTAVEYKQHLRNQLYERLMANLTSSKTSTSSTIASTETLKLILEDLERSRWAASKGILDSLKIKLSSNTKTSSAILNLLSEFDRWDINGQIGFIRHMDMLIHNGTVRLDPFTKKYYIVQSDERVCCQHELEELKEQSLQEFLDSNGACKYCGAQLVHEDDPDDYGQVQFMTTRDMYTSPGAAGEDINTDPDYATLDYFITQALRSLEARLQAKGFVLSATNLEQIKTDTMAFIKENKPSAAKPYGPIVNARPSAQTTDLRLAIMYDIPFMRGEGENERIFLKKSSKSDALVATKAFSLVLSYFRENETDSTTDGIKELYPKFKSDRQSIELLQNAHTAFATMHNMLVMNRLAYCYGALIAHLNLTVNVDYSNTIDMSYLLTDDILFDICDSHTALMNIVLNRHIANIRNGDKATQIEIMPHFDAYLKLFTAPFNRRLYSLGFTSTAIGAPLPAEDRAKAVYQTIFDALRRQNIALYDTIVEKAEKSGGFADYEVKRTMVQDTFESAETVSAPSTVLSLNDALKCWSVNAVKGAQYGQNLWKQYASSNKDIARLDLPEIFAADTFAMETLQASTCSSTVLMSGPILDEPLDDSLQSYIANEKMLLSFKESHAEDLSAIDQEFCEIGIAKPTFNKTQPSNILYYPSVCNKSNAGMETVELRTIVTLQDTDSSLRSEYTEKRFLNNMSILAKYMAIPGYASALGGEIFNRGTGISVARMNFLTNDIAATGRGSVNTIVNNESHALVNNRRYTHKLAEMAKDVPEHLDEIPGFEDDYPTMVKTEAQISRASDITINKRRIFRLQNNGRSISNLLGWLNKDLNEDTMTKLLELAEDSEANNLKPGARYSLEKEVTTGEGYILLDLIKLKVKYKDQIENMHLDGFESVIPQIYNISFLEYQKVMEMLDLPDLTTLSNFRSILFAAIRLDIIMHVKNLRTKQFGIRSLTEEDLVDIHRSLFTTHGQEFVSMITQVLNALATVNMDPNADSINRLYEARQMERISLSMAARAKEKTGFEMRASGKRRVEETVGENLTDENDPLQGEDEADGDNDGQRDGGPEQFDDDYLDDGFDGEEGMNTIQGEYEDDQ